MATRRLSVCAQPGCPELTATGSRCPAHTTIHPRTTTQPSSNERGYGARWRAERRRYLLANPWCRWPGCTEAARDVDHIDGLGPLAPRGYDWANLQGLCHPHHASKSASHDGAMGNRINRLP